MSQPYPAIAVPDLFPSIDAIGRVRPRSRRSDLRGPSRIADGSSSAAFGIASAQTGVKCLASDEANQHPDYQARCDTAPLSLARISTRRFGSAALSAGKSANRSFAGTKSGTTWIASKMSRCATGSPTKTTRTPDDVRLTSASCSAYAPD